MACRSGVLERSGCPERSCSRPRAILLPPLRSSQSCCFVRLISINLPIFRSIFVLSSLRPLVQEGFPRSFEVIRRRSERFLCLCREREREREREMMILGSIYRSTDWRAQRSTRRSAGWRWSRSLALVAVAPGICSFWPRFRHVFHRKQVIWGVLLTGKSGEQAPRRAGGRATGCSAPGLRGVVSTLWLPSLSPSAAAWMVSERMLRILGPFSSKTCVIWVFLAEKSCENGKDGAGCQQCGGAGQVSTPCPFSPIVFAKHA